MKDVTGIELDPFEHTRKITLNHLEDMLWRTKSLLDSYEKGNLTTRRCPLCDLPCGACTWTYITRHLCSRTFGEIVQIPEWRTLRIAQLKCEWIPKLEADIQALKEAAGIKRNK